MDPFLPDQAGSHPGMIDVAENDVPPPYEASASANSTFCKTNMSQGESEPQTFQLEPQMSTSNPARSSTDRNLDDRGYLLNAPMSKWDEQERDDYWERYDGQPGCMASTSGGCCFSSRGGCIFSDRDACCFSTREGCCFSDRGGCCFSDRGGFCFSDNDGCCC